MSNSDVDWEALIDRYIEISNKRDLDAFFEIVQPGLAYYDAFWRETCVGRDLRQYMADWYAVDPCEYTRIGELIVTPDGAAFRYSALARDAADADEASYYGAEVLTAKDGKLVTISDYYCDPSTEALLEVIELSASRHGQSRYATAGFGANHMVEIRLRLEAFAATEGLQLHPDLTALQLAEMMGCTPGQMLALATQVYSDDEKAARATLRVMPASEVIGKILETEPEVAARGSS